MKRYNEGQTSENPEDSMVTSLSAPSPSTMTLRDEFYERVIDARELLIRTVEIPDYSVDGLLAQLTEYRHALHGFAVELPRHVVSGE
jgi:hypothetical protein